MTGIKRLREHGDKYQERLECLANDMRAEAHAIADQIEREQDKVARTDWEAVHEVCDDMAQHVSGIPEFNDLVDRWYRTIAELEPLLCKETSYSLRRDAGCLAPKEDLEALRWVREHGGLEEVEAHTTSLERVCAELRDKTIELRKTIAEMRPRLMPEGMEWLVDAWPRFEDNAPVKLLDDFERYGEENGVSAVTMYRDGSFALNFRAYSKGERVNRPAPEDSWERLEEDAEKDPCGYFGFDGEETCGKCPASGKNCEQTMARDLVRRCRALAGVGE